MTHSQTCRQWIVSPNGKVVAVAESVATGQQTSTAGKVTIESGYSSSFSSSSASSRG